jgi:RNA-directed DNA polymerase
MVLFYGKFTVRLSMRKTQMNPDEPGCASETIWTTWDSIYWNKVARAVKSLQARIVKAVKAKHFHKAKALFFLLTRSFCGKLLAILRVTTNKGSKTCGVDKVLWNTPQRKWKAIEQLSIKGYKAKPLKRKSIPKKNGKLRHLGIPTIRDRAIQAYPFGDEHLAKELIHFDLCPKKDEQSGKNRTDVCPCRAMATKRTKSVIICRDTSNQYSYTQVLD